jgi:hypothetical protein
MPDSIRRWRERFRGVAPAVRERWFAPSLRSLPCHTAGDMTEGNSPPSIGEVAPDFSLPDSQGNTVCLTDACADRPLVLVFYRGHW